jgi:hypothetical protein
MTLPFFDLDGVLRDLVSACQYSPQSWDDPCHGLPVCEYINQHLELLASAPETEYCHLVADLPITILTVQPLHWIPYTRLWIKNHLPFANVKWCQHPLEKMGYLKEGDWLIEDYPLYENNSQIIMIDRAYNRDVTGCWAVWIAKRAFPPFKGPDMKVESGWVRDSKEPE